MTVTVCPNCGSTDLDLAQNVCLNCYFRLDGDPTGAPSPVESVEELQAASDATASAGSVEDQERKLENFEEMVLQRYERGFRVVTLIGFSAAGKSFLANRLRHELELGDWTSEPTFRDAIRKTQALIDWTQLVRRGDPNHRRMLADCDGDSYVGVVDRLVANGDIELLLRRYVVVSAVASAFILVLSAPDLLGRPSNTETGKLIARFGSIVKAILAIQRSVREIGARAAIHAGLQREYLVESMESQYRCKLPIHVLFAQADRLPKSQQFELDPHMFALRHAPTLYRTVQKYFPAFRFDFVSAFEGYRENPESVVDYDLPHYGAVPAFEWVDRMIDGGRIKRAETAAAFKARRLVDSAFRKSTKWVSG
jgi:hypothetical protein